MYNELRCVIGGLLAVVGVMIPMNQLASQTRFEWAPSNFDVSSYQYVEKCLAMVNRVNDSIENRASEHPYTRHWMVWSPYHDYYDIVRKAAAKCGAGQTFRNWILSTVLYRIAGLEDRSDSVIASELSTYKETDTSGIAFALDTALLYSLTTRPVKVAQTRPLIERYLSLEHHLPRERVAAMLWRILSVADFANDTALLAKVLPQSDALIASLNIDTISRETKWIYRRLIITTFEIRQRDSLMSSLAQGVPQYNEKWGGYLRRVSPELYNGSWEIIDQKIDGLHAKFWYPAGEDVRQYPRLGKVTLMVALPLGHYRRIRESIIVAQVKRLKAKFPDIDVILSYRTQGYFEFVEPPTPEHEAHLADSLWLQFHKLSALLLVEETSFWRLPSHDRRRVNELTENERINTLMFQPGVFMIIDQDRNVLWINNAYVESDINMRERDIERKIEALLRRGVNSG